jgi:hypothetical protein
MILKMNLKLLVLLTATVIYSCNSDGLKKVSNKTEQNSLSQRNDGSLSLCIKEAECYYDTLNPSTNTAEWNVFISKTGRYNVWLSSATKDTTDLQYNNSVMFIVLDERVEADPECDKIIHNSGDVTLPYYRADSFLGTLYIQDTGQFYVQIISDRIIPDAYVKNGSSDSEITRLLAINLTPITQ